MQSTIRHYAFGGFEINDQSERGWLHGFADGEISIVRSNGVLGVYWAGTRGLGCLFYLSTGGPDFAL
jgi:hypothetical protein